MRSSRRRTPSIGARKTHFGSTSAWAYPTIRASGFEPEPLDRALAGDDGRGGAVGDALGVARGYRAQRGGTAILAFGQRERRLEAGQRLHRRIAARAFVDGDDGLLALCVADGDGRHLGVEPAGIDGRDRLLMAGERERVLILAADVVRDGDPFRVGTHVAVLDGTPQAVVDGRVDQLPVAETKTETRARDEVRGAVHRFHPAGDDQL